MGVNLSNDHPTMSMNQIICVHNQSNPNSPVLSPISREQFMAKTFNYLELFISKAETTQGLKEVMDLYHKYW